MKKSLLALAVLGAFAGAASAQSSVTVYGIVDTGFTSIDNGGADGSGKARVNGISSGNDAASRIGFKGVEDLGGGLKAEFLLENGISTDTGAGSEAFSRLAYVGLDGGFGKVRLGRQDTQLKSMLGMVDPFGIAGLGGTNNFFNGGGLDLRLSNMVTWQSNNYGGFSAEVGYVFGETGGSTSDNSGYGARIGYKNGPLNVQFGYQNANATQTDADGNIVVGGTDGDETNAALGATYDFGSFKLHGIYGQKKTDADFGTNSGLDEKINSGLIGVTVPFGASAIRADYIRNQNKDVDNADSSVWMVSYTYAMSKRTHLYATYIRTNNDDGSDLGIGGPGKGTMGENSSAIALGIQHKF